MKSTIQYHGGMHFSGFTPSGHEIHWDSGPRDAVTKGATPMEAMLQSTAACSAMDVVSILRKRRKDPEQFEVTVEGVRAEEHPKIFQTITVVYRVKGNGITLQEVEKAVKLSRDKYCSIMNMLRPEVTVDYRIELI